MSRDSQPRKSRNCGTVANNLPVGVAQLAVTKAAGALKANSSPAALDKALKHGHIQSTEHASGYRLCGVCCRLGQACALPKLQGQGTETIRED